MTSDPQHAPRPLIAALMLTATLNPLNSTMIAVALPAIAVAFGVSGSTVTTWLVTSYLIVNIALVTSAGKLGDVLGRRRALRLGQGILALGALMGGLSPILAGVVAGRILMAAGGAVVIPAVMAAIRGEFAPERRAPLFAVLGALMGVAAAIGPVLGGILTNRVGWQAIFLVNAPLLLIAGLLAWRTPIAANPRAERPGWQSLKGFDIAGVGLLVLSLGTLAVGLKIVAWRWGLLSAGAVGMLAFVMWERRAIDPLIDLRLFRKTHFVAGGIVVALQNLSMYALLFQLPFLFERPMGLDPEQSGRILLVMMASMVVSAPIGGFLSQHIGVRRTVVLGLLSGTGGLFMGLRAVDDQSVGLLLLCLAGMGTGMGFVMGPNQAAALSAVSARESGVASGVLSTLRYMGGLAGVTIISVSLKGGNAAEVLAGHRLCLWIYIGAHAAALLVAALLPSRVEDYVEPAAPPPL